MLLRFFNEEKQSDALSIIGEMYSWFVFMDVFMEKETLHSTKTAYRVSDYPLLLPL